MYGKIIVALALDHGFSPRALAVARRLVADGGSILAVHVYEQPSGSVSAYLDDDAVAAGYAAAERRLAEKVAGETGVTPVLLKGHSGRTVADYAAETGADLIVVGSHKPGLRDFFLGSTASRIVRHAPCAVHVLR